MYCIVRMYVCMCVCMFVLYSMNTKMNRRVHIDMYIHVVYVGILIYICVCAYLVDKFCLYIYYIRMHICIVSV